MSLWAPALVFNIKTQTLHIEDTLYLCSETLIRFHTCPIPSFQKLPNLGLYHKQELTVKQQTLDEETKAFV